MSDAPSLPQEDKINQDKLAPQQEQTKGKGREFSEEDKRNHRVKSYVIRAGRMTNAQIRAMEELGPKYLITLDENNLQPLDFAQIFGRQAPLVVEIGFGMGRSFIEMAQKDPLSNYLGIEVHPPGVGACMLLAHEQGVENVRIIQFDAFEVLKKCIAPGSIQALQVFFPDPWPKARHHKRRLINANFINLILPVMAKGGEVRFATDWEEYAHEMLECLNAVPQDLVNTNSEGGFAPRPQWRPLTKFEQRGERLGHGVWDLVFKRV